MPTYRCPKCGTIRKARPSWTRTLNCVTCHTLYSSDDNRLKGVEVEELDEVEVMIVVNKTDFRNMMDHLSNNRGGVPLVGVRMLRAVNGDEGYNLHMFEKGKE